MENDSGLPAGTARTPFLRRHRAAFILAAIVLAIALLVIYRRHEARGGEGGAARLAARGARPEGGPGQSGGMRSHGGPTAVAVARVVRGDIPVRIPALGTVTPLATVTVKTQIAGLLQKIAFQEGQMVTAGQFLAQIDPRPYQAVLDQAEGNLRRDQALLADARLDLKRYEQLILEDSVAGQQLDTQRALVDQYVGTVASDQAAVSSARTNLVYTHIVSPVAGRVGLRQVDQGNYVTPGDTNGIVVVTQLQPISAIFAVPEDNATEIMRRLQAGDTLTAEAFDRSNSRKIADGRVETLDNQIDATTGTIKIRALFDNQQGLLFANQFVNIQLVESVLHDQTILPSSAVHRGAPNGVAGSFVYVVDTTAATVAVRSVTLGVADGEHVVALSGVSAGDLVVTEGGDRLRDGAAVLLPSNDPRRKAPTDGSPAAAAKGQHRRHPRPEAAQ